MDILTILPIFYPIKAPTRRLCMLRELCTAYNMARHNPYQGGLHSQPGWKVYTMTLQCVYRRKSDEIDILTIFADILS